MGLAKLLDKILLVYFVLYTVVVPLYDALLFPPSHIFPDFLIRAKWWYIKEFDDYLPADKPPFFVGLATIDLLLMVPLAAVNVYGIVAKKAWFKTTCLIHGVSFTTVMVALLSDLVGSPKASIKTWMVYIPFLVFSLLAVLRGLLVVSQESSRSSDKLE